MAGLVRLLHLLWLNTLWPLRLRFNSLRGYSLKHAKQQAIMQAYSCDSADLVQSAPGRIVLNGSGQLDEASPTLIVVNHRSWLDILLLLVVFRQPLAFVLKQSLARLPCIGPVFRLLAFPFVDRQVKDKQQAFDHALKRYFQNSPLRHLVVFPEGTRYAPSKAERSPYRHLLKPHSVGLLKLLPHFSKVLDVTIDYGQQDLSLLAWLSGRIRRIQVTVNDVSGEWMQGDRRVVHHFFHDLWQRKDEQLKASSDEHARASAASDPVLDEHLH